MFHRNCVAAALSISAWGIVSAAPAEDWPNFRGPRFDGKCAETGLRLEWKEPIPLAWEAKVGPSYSSFACVGDRVYTCGQVEKQQTLFCFDAKTGKVAWSAPFEKAWTQNSWDGPRSTPTVSDGRVYVQGASGRLICVAAADGKLIWEKQFSNVPQWGYAGSVLIEGDMAVASGGKEQGALVAFDRVTGAEKWKSGDDPTGYSSPYPFTFGGKRYIASMSGVSAIVVDAATGKLALRIPWKTDYDVNAASPIFQDGHLLLTSGYQTGAALYKLTAKSDGTLDAAEVWKSKVMLNKFNTPILHDGNLYVSDQKDMVCVDFLTGSERWRMPRLKDGGIAFCEGHLLFLDSEGTLRISKASPEKFSPIAEVKLMSDRCWTVPVLHDGRLYVRDNVDRVACFNLKP